MRQVSGSCSHPHTPALESSTFTACSAVTASSYLFQVSYLSETPYLRFFSCRRQNFPINANGVNTLSAKADSFFEHPTYWRGCAQLARSRPGTLKNVERRVLVSIHHKAAFASVNASCQRLGNVLAARGADLARVVRGHLFYFTTSLCNFVCEYGDEARPCDVGNSSGKSVVPDHPLDVQAFHSNPAVARNQVIGNFVPVLSAKVSHSSVQPVDLSTLLCPVASTLLLASERSLRTPQLRQFACKKTRVGNLFSVRSRCELSEPYVKTYSREKVCDLDWLGNFACQDDKPFIGFAFQGKCFDLSLNFTMKTDADRPNVLNSQRVSFESDSVAVTWVKNRVEPVGAFESRVTRFFTGFDASKEVLESFIEPAERCLSTAEIDTRKPSVFRTFVFKPAGLIFVATRDLPFAVEPLTLRQCGIVKSSVGLEHNPKFTLLVGVGPKAKLIGAKHRSFPFLTFYVFTNRCLADVTHAARVVAPGPKRREPTAQESKFLSQDTAGITFESIGDLRDRKRWVTLKKQVNVIGHDFHRMYCQGKLICLFKQQRSQTLGNSIRENRPAVLRTPNQVKLQRENRAGVACVSRHCIIIQQANIYSIQNLTKFQPAIPPLPEGSGSLAF